MASIIVTEQISQFDIQTVLLQGNISPEDRCTLEKMRKNIRKFGKNDVEYKFRTRLTACGPSLQYVSKAVRSYFCKDNFVDLDMDSCALRIIKSLIKDTEHQGLVDKILEIKKNTSDKKLINAFLFGNLKINDLSDAEHFQFKKMRQDIVNDHKSIHKVKKNVYNFDGTAFSHIIFYYEYIIINCTVDFFKMKCIDFSTIVFDGVHVSKDITDEDIISLQDYITESTDISTVWKIKEWDEPVTINQSEDNLDNLSTHSTDSKKDNIHDIIFDEFIDWACELKLIRLKDTNLVLKRKCDYHAENKYKSADETLNAFIETKQNLFKGAGLKAKRENIIVFLKSNQPNDDFPVKTRDWKFFGYSNGLYNIETNEFTTEDFPDTLCRNYFDIPWNPMVTVPSQITKIFTDQGFTQETQKCILFMLGRAYFPVGFDTCGNVLNCCGATTTGKSTLIEMIKNSLSQGSCTTLSTVRKDFGLYGKNNMELLIVNESENLMKGISEEDFKSMCRGEELVIEGKGRDAVSEHWTTPILLASQNPIKVDDTSGAINKQRIVNVFFTKLIKPDPNVKRIINENISQFIPYLIKLYHEMCNVYRNSEQIDNWNDEILAETDPFTEWINSHNDNLYQQIIYQEGSVVSKEKLQRAWSKYYKFSLNKHTEPPKISKHNEAILYSMGIEKTKKMFCSFCKNLHGVNCCNKQSRSMRTCKISYDNCAIIDGALNQKHRNYTEFDPE